MRKLSLLSLLLLLALASCTYESARPTSGDNPERPAPPDPLAHNRDTTVSPGQDFFHYANGGWFNAHPIPETERSNGLWRMIGDTINAQVRSICERSANDKSAAKGSNKQKIGDFYASGMDSVKINADGIKPLEGELKKISEVKDLKSLAEAIAHLHTIGAGPAFGVWVSQDDKISTKHAVFFSQGGLGLGERDYYFNSDARSKDVRKEYEKHVGEMFRLMGSPDPVKEAATVMKLETELARSSRKLEDLRDPVKNYNKMTADKMNSLAAAIDWKGVLTTLGINGADTVIIGQPEYFSALSNNLKKFSLDEWKVYLRWHLVNAFATALSQEFDKEHFNFFSKYLGGAEQQRPRWKRVVEHTNDMLGELIGQVYVEEYLPKGTKEKLLEIGNAIRDVYGDHIRKLDWMSEETKTKALKKLSTVVMKVGYPDKWKDMSALEIDRSSYCANVMRANQWHHNYNVSKFGKPVDRTEWSMYPQTYNAYYNPSNNEIVVPACNIIVPGFEGRMPDDAILYSIIGGSTFGHEITHGFDDQGSQYDENGNLNNWWTKEDRQKFEAKTKLMVDQFSEYVIDSLHINGEATLGENIADLGGVVMGYEAFMKTNQYKSGEKIAGLTPDQRFWLGYAYAWMINMKPQSIRRLIMTDVHSPAQYRVNGPLANLEAFYKTFGIKEGDAMWRPAEKRVVIW